MIPERSAIFTFLENNPEFPLKVKCLDILSRETAYMNPDEYKRFQALAEPIRQKLHCVIHANFGKLDSGDGRVN